MNDQNVINEFDALPVEPEKRRAGLYLDQDLFRLIEKIAKMNDLSWNDCAVKLVRRGISTLRKTEANDGDIRGQ
jgi:hypothetical protein